MSSAFERMKMREEASRPSFERMVDEDIDKCENYLSGERDKQIGFDLHFELITKYPSYITRFGVSLYNYNEDIGFSSEYFGEEAMIDNLKAIKNKLIAFKNFGYRNPNPITKDTSTLTVANTLTATQNQNITITFDEVIRSVKEMTALSDTETKETLDKIDEIKAVVELKESPKTKWQKIKPILTWMADKSVDVGITLLPLILKITD